MTPFEPIPHLILLAILTMGAFGLGSWKWKSQPAVLLITSGILLCAIGVGLWKPAWGFNPPLSWLLMGRRECYVIAFAGPLLLFGLMTFVRSALLRGVVIFAVGAVVVFFGFLPIVAVFWGESAALKPLTALDSNGVCRQSTGITCGPAATVTVLRKLGIDVKEREVALACGTSSCGGTAADLIAQTLRAQLGEKLVVDLVYCRSPDELPALGEGAQCYALAIVKLTTHVDHCVALLDRSEQMVTIGDPMGGLRRVPTVEFAENWKGIAVVVKRRGGS